MSTKRYSGEIVIRITYIETYDPNGMYRCFLKGPNGQTETVFVGAPAFLSEAVDSPEAFDSAAEAAIAFADHEAGENGIRWGELAAYDIDGAGSHIGRSPAKAWPQEKKAV